MRGVLVLALVLASSAAGQQAEIRKEMARQQDAWNRGDVKSFMESYERTATVTFVGAAGVTRGYEPVLNNYVKRYPTRDAMGQLTFSQIEVHPLGAGHAWALGRFHLKRNAAGGGDSSGVFTLVWKKDPGSGAWKVVLDHTTADAKPPAAAAAARR